MTNYKEILRLSGLGLAKQDIAASCQCSRNTVRNVLNAAQEHGITWATARESSNEALRDVLFPGAANKPLYRMPDYEYVHQEMQKSGVTLSLLWVEYCEQCRANGEMPYQSTQFNKYYADFVHKTNATMHLEHKPGDTMQVDWAGQTAAIIDTDTGERIQGIPVHCCASFLRLCLHRGISGYKARSMDQRPCSCLPVFWRCHQTAGSG